MSSLNGYDKQHISFFIPVENTKQTFLAAIPDWTFKKNTDTQLLDDLGFVQLKVLKSNSFNRLVMWCSVVRY